MRSLLLALLLLAPLTLAQSVHDIKITSDRAPDVTSLKAIVASVTRDCKTDDEKAVAIYNYCRYAYYHYAYPSEDGDIAALKMINVYGWGLCGGQHTVQAAIWEAAGYKWRYRGWSNPGHTTVEVFYGDRWHYLDTFLKFYCWMPDPAHPGQLTIAGQEDIKANPALITDHFVMDESRKAAYFVDDRFAYVGDKANWTAPAFMVCGDDLPGVIQGIKSSNNSGSPRGWAGMKFDNDGYSTAVDLAPGYALTLDWSRQDDAWVSKGSKTPPRHTCGDKEYKNDPVTGPLLEPYAFKSGSRSWSNGTLVFKPDLKSDAVLSGLKDTQNVARTSGQLAPKDPSQPATITIEMASPYVTAKAAGSVSTAATGADVKAELSTDGKKWAPADLAKLDVNGKYRYWVRLTFAKPITAIELTAVVQHNQQALAYLAPGNNVLTVTAANPAEVQGKCRTVITYGYQLGSRDKTPEQMLDRNAEIGRGHYAKWDEPIVVQTVVDHFPATIAIPIPTPKGKQPVYPKMLFMRREVLAPGQEPAPTLAAPTKPTVAADQTLATLPEPWTIGIHAPKPQPAKPTKPTTLAPTKTSYVNKTGETFAHSFLKTPKDNSNAWILLADFDTTKLPDAKQLQSAKLIVHVVDAHDKGNTQAAAIVLDAPFEPNKPYDFSKLGRSVGTTTIAKGTGPHTYEIDVTPAVRAWLKGEKNNGLALKIIPNRAVDEGWTVRFTPDKDKPVELQVNTYAE